MRLIGLPSLVFMLKVTAAGSVWSVMLIYTAVILEVLCVSC
jgi:hypothetical protein